ncbi:MAG: hypothetical protein AAF327_11155 [Cyanobacteria bacterium P01_A01_bin.37]
MNSTDIKDGPLFCGDDFYHSLEDCIFHLHEWSGFVEDDYPVEVRYANEVACGHVISTEDLCVRIFEEYLEEGFGRFPITAEYFANEVAEGFLESTCEMCDIDEWPEEIDGLKRLTDLIDWVLFWNIPIYRLLGDFEWFNPSQHCIGLEVLEGALETFERVNRAKHFTYTEGPESALITWEFVKDYVGEGDR